LHPGDQGRKEKNSGDVAEAHAREEHRERRKKLESPRRRRSSPARVSRR